MAENDSSLLTNEMVQDAPTKKKPYTIRDGRGLFVLVHPNGSRYFQLRATVNGKRKLMQIGVYPTISIEEARLLAAKRLQEAMTQEVLEEGELSLTQQTSVKVVEKNVEIEISASLIIDEVISTKEKELQNEPIEFSEIAEFAEETLSKTTPKVNLAYSDLVYVTKNPNKTFVQKLNVQFKVEQRLHFFQRKCARMYIASRAWAFTNAIILALKLKGVKASFPKIALSQVKAYLKLTFIKKWLRQHLWALGIRLNHLRKSLLTVESHFVSWADRKAAALLSLFKTFWESAVKFIKGAPKEFNLEEIKQASNVPKIVSGSNAVSDKIYTINLKPLSLLAIWRASLSRVVRQEARSTRDDDVHVYGLFAETKGNYLIYTIKAMLANLLVKKG